MRIIVTGGNGFIGHTLVRHLLDEGNEVKVIDIKPIKFSHKNLEFVKKSVLEDIRWEMRDCDMVYHLAAELGVVNSDKRPLNTLAVNIDGTVNVFRCALKTFFHNQQQFQSKKLNQIHTFFLLIPRGLCYFVLFVVFCLIFPHLTYLYLNQSILFSFL